MERLHYVTREHVRIVSAILTVLGAFYCWQAWQLPMGDPLGSEAGGTPMLIGTLWVLLGAYVTLRAPGPANHDEEVGTWPDRRMAGRLVAVAVLCAGFIVLLPWLGTITTSFAFMAIMARMCGATWLRSIVSALVLSLAFWGLFAWLLELSLPSGALFNGLGG